MKYLKKFESNGELYSKITYGEYLSYGEELLTPFTLTEIDNINQLLGTHNINQVDVYTDLAFDKSDTSDYQPLEFVASKLNVSYFATRFKDMPIPTTPHVLIHKLIDEWYLIRIGGSPDFFKCDQFDGLIKCLNDLLK